MEIGLSMLERRRADWETLGVDVAEVIRRRRQELGLSQADLAVRAGTDARAIRRYEAGEIQPSLTAAKAIANALEISLDVLVGGAPTSELLGEWVMTWRPTHFGIFAAQATETVEIRHRGLDLEIVLPFGGNQEVFPEGWRVELRVVGEAGYMGTYAAGGLYGALSLEHRGDVLVGGWISLPSKRQGGVGYLALGRDVDPAIAAMKQFVADHDSLREIPVLPRVDPNALRRGQTHPEGA